MKGFEEKHHRSSKKRTSEGITSSTKLLVSTFARFLGKLFITHSEWRGVRWGYKHFRKDIPTHNLLNYKDKSRVSLQNVHYPGVLILDFNRRTYTLRCGPQYIYTSHVFLGSFSDPHEETWSCIMTRKNLEDS